MSKYSENTTQFKDLKCLLAALVDMGFPLEEIEVNTVAKPLHDWHNNKTHYLNGKDDDTAEIIIHRQFVNRRLSSGASNDIGFKKNANGTYSAIISEYDSHFANAAWLGKLKTNYAQHGLINQMQKKGFKYVPSATTVKNGKRQLSFVQA